MRMHISEAEIYEPFFGSNISKKYEHIIDDKLTKEQRELLPLLCKKFEVVSGYTIACNDDGTKVYDKQGNCIVKFERILDKQIRYFNDTICMDLGYSGLYIIIDTELDRGIMLYAHDIEEIYPGFLKVEESARSINTCLYSKRFTILHKLQKILDEGIYSTIGLKKIDRNYMILHLHDARREEYFDAALDMTTLKLNQYALHRTKDPMINGVMIEPDERLAFAVKYGYNIITPQLYDYIEACNGAEDKFIGVRNKDKGFWGYGIIDTEGNEVVPCKFGLCNYTGYRKYFQTVIRNDDRQARYGIYDGENKKELISDGDSYNVADGICASYIMRDGIAYILGNSGVYNDIRQAFPEVYRNKTVDNIFKINVYGRYHIVDNAYNVIKNIPANTADLWERVEW